MPGAALRGVAKEIQKLTMVHQTDFNVLRHIRDAARQ